MMDRDFNIEHTENNGKFKPIKCDQGRIQTMR